MDILVYSGLERLGDGVMKLPFVGALRRRWPEARLTWLAGKGTTVYPHPLAPLGAGPLRRAGAGSAPRRPRAGGPARTGGARLARRAARGAPRGALSVTGRAHCTRARGLAALYARHRPAFVAGGRQ